MWITSPWKTEAEQVDRAGRGHLKQGVSRLIQRVADGFKNQTRRMIMGTRCMIYCRKEDGFYQGIYCHNEGYPEYTGLLLYLFYGTYGKVSRLMELGDLSRLGADIGHKVDFTQMQMDSEYRKNAGCQCCAYARDRGEKWHRMDDIPEDQLQREGYNYVYKEGCWYLAEDDRFIPLPEKLSEYFKDKKHREETYEMFHGWMTEKQMLVIARYLETSGGLL